MELNGALRVIGRTVGLSTSKLIRYSKEYDGDNERKVLYAIVRALKPFRCLEIGTSYGDGTMCIATALEANDNGFVYTVDINPDIGQHFTPELVEKRIRIFTEDANLFVTDPNRSFSFIFEDGNHSPYQVHQVYKHLPTLLRPGGIIISHDAAIEGVRDYVRQGQMSAGYDLPVYVIDPCIWGMTVYRKPKTGV